MPRRNNWGRLRWRRRESVAVRDLSPRLFSAHLRASNLPNKIHLILPVWRPIGMKNFVMPYNRLTIDIRLGPRIPRQPSLRLAGHEAPVNRRNLVLLRHRQNPLESTLVSSRHVLGAKNRPMVALQLIHMLLKVLRRTVVVK